MVCERQEKVLQSFMYSMFYNRLTDLKIRKFQQILVKSLQYRISKGMGDRVCAKKKSPVKLWRELGCIAKEYGWKSEFPESLQLQRRILEILDQGLCRRH